MVISMNNEKELLIQKCCENPILQTITAHIAYSALPGDQVRIRMEDLNRSTGLSDGQIRNSINWLMRKGLLVGSVEGPFPQRGSRYVLDPDLHTASRPGKVRRFGEVGEKILSSSIIETEFQMNVLSFGENGEVCDEYGSLLSINDAKELCETLSSYVQLAEAWGNAEWELHRESRRNLLPWSRSWNNRYGHVSNGMKPPALICQCLKCKNDYDRALTAWTNFLNYQKQERKLVREAMKELV